MLIFMVHQNCKDMSKIDKISAHHNAKCYQAGDKIGNCYFVEEIISRKYGRRTALFRCDCGNEFKSTITSVNRGQRCGCTRFKHLPKGRPIKHGQAGKNNSTSEYKTWCGMKARCSNNKNKRYKDYGGRGIKVCERWLLNFDNFFTDMGAKPTTSHTLERVNVNGNYEKENCIWLLSTLQSKNKRTNRVIIFNGVSKLLSEWAQYTGIARLTIHRRLRDGWSIEDALTLTPLNKPYKSRKI